MQVHVQVLATPVLLFTSNRSILLLELRANVPATDIIADVSTRGPCTNLGEITITKEIYSYPVLETQQTYILSRHIDLFSLTLFGLGSLGRNLLATSHVAGIRCSLTLDTAITIEMASSTSLGRDTGFVGTARVGAGLGSPVAVTAMEFTLHLASINHRKDGFKYETTE